MIGKLREMDESLTFGQFCHVIKDTNSEIRHVRKVSATGQVCFYAWRVYSAHAHVPRACA